MMFRTFSFGLTGLITALASPALAVETCDMNLAVTTDTGAQAVIIGGPVAEMCVIKMADGNMLPYRMANLAVSGAEPAPTDARSVTQGTFGCMVVGDATGAIQLTIEMAEDNSYRLTDQGLGLTGQGTWKPYDALSLEFLDGPLENSFVDAQNGSMRFVEWNGRPAMLCKKAA